MLISGNDGREEVVLTPKQEKLVVYIRRLYDTLGAQATDAIFSRCGIRALLKEKSQVDMHEEKMKKRRERKKAKEDDDPIAALLGRLTESDQEDECSCIGCRARRSSTHNYLWVTDSIQDSIRHDMGDLFLKTPPALGREVLVGIFTKAMALGYVLGRDEKKITSGKYDAELDQIDRLNAVNNLDKMLESTEGMMNIEGDSPIAQMVSMASEEAREVIKIMKKFILNAIIPPGEVHHIASSIQQDHMASKLPSFLGGTGEPFSITERLEECLSEREQSIKRLRDALEQKQ